MRLTDDDMRVLEHALEAAMLPMAYDDDYSDLPPLKRMYLLARDEDFTSKQIADRLARAKEILRSLAAGERLEIP